MPDFGLAKPETLEEMITRSVPGVSIDCVILGYDQTLKVLLTKWKGLPSWSLPGGFLYQDENMDIAAQRILSQRTGLSSLFLSQFMTFSDTNRRGQEDLEVLNQLIKGLPIRVKNWFKQRFITIGYFALADIRKSQPEVDDFSDHCDWVALDQLPPLIFDHELIIRKALEHIRIQLNYLPFGISLLPQKFTMGDIQRLYEAILDRKIDRGNFQKKMLKLGIFTRLEKQLNGGAHKAPYLYRFDQKAYNRLLEQGIGFI